MANRSSKPASPATSCDRNQIICSSEARAANHGKSGSPWPGPACLRRSNQAMKPSTSDGISEVSGATALRSDSTNAISAAAIFASRTISPAGASSGSAGLRRSALYLVSSRWKCAKPSPVRSAAHRVQSARSRRMLISLQQINSDTDHRNAIDTVIGRTVQFLAEYIRINLLVGHPHRTATQPRRQRVVQIIAAVDDRRAGVEKKASAARQAWNTLLNEAQGQIRTKAAAAMAIGALEFVHQIRWIGDDQII